MRELHKIQPDIVHGQGTEAAYAFAAVTSPYPNVITFHGIMHRVHEVVPPPLISVQRAAPCLEKLVARGARHVISISKDVEEFLESRHSPPPHDAIEYQTRWDSVFLRSRR
jgi:Glycosyltransferase Family 4